MSERHAQAMEAMPHSLPMMGISELWICRTVPQAEWEVC